MPNIGYIASELAVSFAGSTAIATSVDASPLLTALITFGVSVVTLVGGEVIKFLVAYFKKKTDELEKPKKKKGDNQK